MDERVLRDPVFAIAQVMVLVKIILTVVVFDPRSLDTFTLPKSVAAHATSLVIAALLVWLLFRHGRSTLSWSPLHVGAAALLLAFAAATPFALDRMLAVFGTFKRYLGLTQMFDDVLLYLSVSLLFRDPRSLKLLAGVAIGTAIPVLGYALVQHAGHDPFTFAQASTVIPISTLGNPDIVGGFLSVVGITALSFCIILGGRPLAWYRAALAIIGIACAAVLYLTGVRAGVLGLAGGWLATVVLTMWMPGIGGRRRMGIVAVAVALALGVFVSPLGPRLDPRGLLTDQAVTNRLEIWRAAIASVAERPVLGLGPDNFAAAYPSHRQESSIVTGNLENSTHDVWLYAATSAGAIGVIALLLFVGLAVWTALRLMRRGDPAAYALVPLAAYLGQSLVNVNEIVVDWTFWASAGVIAGASSVAIGVRRRSQAPRPAWPAGVGALAVASIATMVLVLPRLAAGEALLAAEAYSSAGRDADGLANGAAAVEADPRRAESWSTDGSALYRGGHFIAAIQAFNTAAIRQPWHPLSWSNLALTWLSLGDPNAAIVAADRAIAADRYDGDSHEMLAEASYRLKDYARAAAEGEKALAYELPPRESAYFTTISAYVQLKQYDRAEPLSRVAAAKFGSNQLRLQHIGILADMGRKPEALAELDQLIAERPTLVAAQQLRKALTGQ